MRDLSQAACTVRDPGQAAWRAVTQARTRGVRQPRPGSTRSIWVLSFFFFFGFSDMFWAGLLFESLDSFIFFYVFQIVRET